jgi:hypothetical protein
VRPPDAPTTACAAKVEPQEAEALAATKVYDSTPLALNLEKLDLDCAECGTQAAQFSGSQILGEGLFRFDRRAGRGDIRTYIKNQESADKQLDQLQLKLAYSS